MNVFVGLELDDGESSVPGGGEHVNHGTIAGSESGDLRIDVQTIEARIEDRYVAKDQRADPAFGDRAVNGVGAIAGVASAGAMAGVIGESLLVGSVDREFGGSDAEVELLSRMEGIASDGEARAGELQAMQ